MSRFLLSLLQNYTFAIYHMFLRDSPMAYSSGRGESRWIPGHLGQLARSQSANLPVKGRRYFPSPLSAQHPSPRRRPPPPPPTRRGRLREDVLRWLEEIAFPEDWQVEPTLTQDLIVLSLPE